MVRVLRRRASGVAWRGKAAGEVAREAALGLRVRVAAGRRDSLLRALGFVRSHVQREWRHPRTSRHFDLT